MDYLGWSQYDLGEQKSEPKRGSVGSYPSTYLLGSGPDATAFRF